MDQPTNVRLAAWQKRALARIAANKNTTVSVVIRSSVTNMIAYAEAHSSRCTEARDFHAKRRQLRNWMCECGVSAPVSVQAP